MKKIGIFDTYICSANLGDQIIMDSVIKELERIFNDDFFISFPTHERIWFNSYKELKNVDISIVGGSNLLSSNMNHYNQWKINMLDIFFLKGVVLMGVGWWQYQNNPNYYTRFLLKSVLSSKYYHSVRDNYTKKKIESMGFRNVLYTACPTMWKLTPLHCEKIPWGKAENVICTITDYNIDKIKDKQMIEILRKNYKKVYIWIQGSHDYDFIKSLGFDDIILIYPKLNAFDIVLDSEESIDYVGTRLHAGIRAIQHFRRCIIIGIDNRSLEISRDTNLKVIFRKDINKLNEEIYKELPTKLNIPFNNIEKWRSQFN